MLISRFFIFTAIALFSVGCSGSGAGNADINSPDSIDHIVVSKRDSAAYLSGVADATALLDAVNDRHRLHDGLLEVRAHETHLRTTELPQAADAYIKGFRHHIFTHNDSLARILF